MTLLVRLNCCQLESIQHEQVPGMKTQPIEKKHYRSSACHHTQTTLHQHELKVLRTVFDIIANSSLTSLMFKKKKLDHLRDRLMHIHPLNSIEAILNDAELKQLFEKVYHQKGIVWSQCLAGYDESIKVQKSFNNLIDFLPDFASKTGVNLERLSQVFNGKSLSSDHISFLLDV